jgi:hypothetical protein
MNDELKNMLKTADVACLKAPPICNMDASGSATIFEVKETHTVGLLVTLCH